MVLALHFGTRLIVCDASMLAESEFPVKARGDSESATWTRGSSPGVARPGQAGLDGVVRCPPKVTSQSHVPDTTKLLPGSKLRLSGPVA